MFFLSLKGVEVLLQRPLHASRGAHYAQPVCVCVYVCMYVCMCMYVYTCFVMPSLYVCVCMYVCMYVCIYIYIYIYMYVCMLARGAHYAQPVYACVYVCMCVCMYASLGAHYAQPVYVCMYVCFSWCMRCPACVCMHACVCTCVCVCVCRHIHAYLRYNNCAWTSSFLCIHTHTHTHTRTHTSGTIIASTPIYLPRHCACSCLFSQCPYITNTGTRMRSSVPSKPLLCARNHGNRARTTRKNAILHVCVCVCVQDSE